MVLIVPSAKDGLTEVEKNVASINLAEILSKTNKTSIEVYIPKFKLEYSQDLKETLSKVGRPFSV